MVEFQTKLKFQGNHMVTHPSYKATNGRQVVSQATTCPSLTNPMHSMLALNGSGMTSSTPIASGAPVFTVTVTDARLAFQRV